MAVQWAKRKAERLKGRRNYRPRAQRLAQMQRGRMGVLRGRTRGKPRGQDAGRVSKVRLKGQEKGQGAAGKDWVRAYIVQGVMLRGRESG